MSTTEGTPIRIEHSIPPNKLFLPRDYSDTCHSPLDVHDHLETILVKSLPPTLRSIWIEQSSFFRQPPDEDKHTTATLTIQGHEIVLFGKIIAAGKKTREGRISEAVRRSSDISAVHKIGEVVYGVRNNSGELIKTTAHYGDSRDPNISQANQVDLAVTIEDGASDEDYSEWHNPQVVRAVDYLSRTLRNIMAS